MAKMPKNTAPLPDDLVTSEELAMLFALSPATLEGWRVARKGPPYYRLNGRTVRYSRREALAWAASDRVVIGEERE